MNPWRTLLGMQDRHRYLRLLEPDGARPAYPSPADPTHTGPTHTGPTHTGPAHDEWPDDEPPDAPDDGSPDDPPDGESSDATTGRPGRLALRGRARSRAKLRARLAARTREVADAPAPTAVPDDDLGPTLDLDAPLARRDHPLLRAPASVSPRATAKADPRAVHRYADHSVDLVLRGGLASAVAGAGAACAVAEEFVVRRVAGSSLGAAGAALVAAAELGRTEPADGAPTGFAGLAGTLGWLAGQDAAQAVPRAMADPDGARPAGWPEQHRVLRLLQPSAAGRDGLRLLHVLSGADRRRPGALVAAWAGVAGSGVRWVTALVALGSAITWAGVLLALHRGGTPGPVLVALGLALLVTLALATVAAALLATAATGGGRLGAAADRELYGLVPGVPLPQTEGGPRGLAAVLDRAAGLPAAGDVPPLATWLADRLDALAGLPPHRDDGADEQRGLTFGELWLGRVGPLTETDLPALRRAADDADHRVVDLRLTAVNLSQSRPVTFPPRRREHPLDADGYHFCRGCLTEVLPLRTVTQLLLASPDHLDPGVACPRHEAEPLHALPEPWDLPVAAALRVAVALPGLIRAVPLVTLDVARPARLQDEYGHPEADRTSPGAPLMLPRVQWLGAASGSAEVAADAFDTALPRWPTIGLRLDGAEGGVTDDGRLAEWVTVPDQDAGPAPARWRRLGRREGTGAFLAAVLATALDARGADLAVSPVHRGRVALLRSTGTLPVRQPDLLRLTLRGYHAGRLLAQRFRGADGHHSGQTQLDRYRWARLRRALRDQRRTSLQIGARMPLYADLASGYRVPEALRGWFTPPPAAGGIDPAWTDAAASLAHLTALSAGGVLDWDTDYGAPPD